MKRSQPGHTLDESHRRKGVGTVTKRTDTIDWDHLTPREALKLEIAKEIGCFDKVAQGGWRCLSAKESGRIGGILARRSRKESEEAE